MHQSAHGNTFSSPQNSTDTTTLADVNYGDAEVQFKQGLKFAAGSGASPDYVKAAEWYLKAAAQNHFLAQFNLGMMYAHGQGVRRDSAQSRMWLDKAAQQGDAAAQFHLGNNCQRASFSQSVPDAAESRIEAYKWYRLAAAQGYQGSELAHATLTLTMTRADIVAGNQRMAAFQPGKP
jgi:TPR repeat protein